MTSSSPCDPPGPARRPTPSRPSAPLRDRRVVGLGVLLLLAATATVTLARAGERATAPATADGGRTSYAARADGQPRPATYPRTGTGDFATAPGESPVRGTDGPLLHYRVAVEQGTGQDVDSFAATVDEVLGDPRSWIASEELRLRRVAQADDADFTVHLATPETSERMCAEGGLSTGGHTSCRLPGQVIINLARWLQAVPDYGAPLAIYRAYVVNHEVGHELGEEHQACPGPGEPAPVMQQQTYGLDGCAANAWPYVDGSRYDGEVVPGT
ncbi:DUF3152 domain-containing protein [Micromonospora sp. C31]|uniref:DUF3152 domain-containing protein n=1 Tax=Micromonospora sp. C31 TaxID=2824876 RepID=UPI001B35E81C|nr:DUF3152 domain-containing protein [Micromonospora sp. C31]MBQ1072140.1 DUF3152 domain-containing protein [Micromonospora sp. C31]